MFQRNVFKYKTYFNKTYGWVNVGVLKDCGIHLIEVSPMNGWHKNGGLGKPAIIRYGHFIGN